MSEKKLSLPKTILTSTALFAFMAVGATGGYVYANASANPTTNSTQTITTAATTNLNLVDIVSTTADLSTLKTAIIAAGLTDTVKNGEFTVLAPTNAAFAKLPSQTLADLLKPENKKQLENILLYHVIAGKFDAETIKKQTSVKTVLGQEISVKVEAGTIVLNGTVKVTAGDIQASNGIAHVIDTVLIPSPVQPTTNPNLVDIVSATADLSTLKTAIVAAGLTDTVKNGEFTVLAPTNAAFAKLPSQTLADLLKPENKKQLENILLYHVIAGKFDAETIKKQTSVKTVLGQEISVKVEAGTIVLNGTVKVIAGDIQASNGIAHVIDTVLIPTSATPSSNSSISSNSSTSSTSSTSSSSSANSVNSSQSSVKTPTVVQANTPTLAEALNSPSLSTLKELIGIAGINPETVTNSTVFAPTNDAFAKLPASLVSYLKHNPAVLKQIILGHVVNSQLNLQAVLQFLSSSDAPVLNANSTPLSLSTKDGKVFVNSSQVIQTDISTQSGIVHLVDRVIL